MQLIIAWSILITLISGIALLCVTITIGDRRNWMLWLREVALYFIAMVFVAIIAWAFYTIAIRP